MFLYKDSMGFVIGAWFFTFWFNPKVWWIDFHRNASCCKWWLLIGPFEINRVYIDEEWEAMNEPHL